MREIKFRAWDIQNKKWYPLPDWGICEANAVGKEDGTMELTNDDFFTWSQYTGLKDKNGKEIYEGDVVFHHNKKYSIEYATCRYKLRRIIQGDKEGRMETLHEHPHEFEIIGNIYENPELLK